MDQNHITEEASLIELFSQNHILCDTKTISEYTANISAFQKRILGVFLPKNLEELKNILSFASKTKIPIYPISRGCNWGMGSKLPAKDDCLVVDLSKMNCIQHMDEEFGYVSIEPGVSQLELSQFLANKKSRWFIDVTGSSPHSSVIGNSLERGMSYSGMRIEKVVNVSVLTTSGEIFTTGFNPSSKLKNIYKYGIGPSYDGLFFQSNFGIIVGMTIQLERVPEHSFSYTLSFNESTLGQVAEVCGELLREGALTGIPHIFNKARLFSAAEPMLYESYEEHEKPDIVKLRLQLSKLFPNEWFLGGSIGGPKELNLSRIKLIKKKLKPLGRLMVTTPKMQAWAHWITQFFRMDLQRRLIEVTKPLSRVSYGVPSIGPMNSIHWQVFTSLANPQELLQPDLGSAGAIYISPLCPNRSEDIHGLLNLTKTILKAHEVPLNIALNMAKPNLLEGVLSLHFDKNSQSEEFHRIHKELVSVFTKNGYSLYRGDIVSGFDLMQSNNELNRSLTRAIKDYFDPKGIVSPGRYGIM